jgi:hypothetical protein
MPFGLELCDFQAVADAVTVTSSASANAKGAWTQLNSAQPRDACFVLLQVSTDYGSATINSAIDLGVGSSGNEVAILNNLVINNSFEGDGNVIELAIPLLIPAGERLAARCQSSSASQSLGVSLFTWDGAYSMEGVNGAEAVGFQSGSTEGTSVTAGASSLGSYTQLTAATPRDYVGYFMMFDFLKASLPTADFIVANLAIGASGSEVVIDSSYGPVFSSSQKLVGGPSRPAIFRPIPAGTRIAMNAEGAAVSFGATLYGLF